MTLYDNNTIENNYIRNIQMINFIQSLMAGIYIKSSAFNYWARNTSITNNTILSHRGPGILIDSEDLTVQQITKT